MGSVWVVSLVGLFVVVGFVVKGRGGKMTGLLSIVHCRAGLLLGPNQEKIGPLMLTRMRVLRYGDQKGGSARSLKSP